MGQRANRRKGSFERLMMKPTSVLLDCRKRDALSSTDTQSNDSIQSAKTEHR
jgi:hypothetical protein